MSSYLLSTTAKSVDCSAFSISDVTFSLDVSLEFEISSIINRQVKTTMKMTKPPSILFLISRCFKADYMINKNNISFKNKFIR